ncbi:hypothetical protein MWU65_01525 [Cellulophaga sp. F20128]|uniref:hypothetical protein n=1 Tax=Cellulophaga sp. F20128 TaxID=2926413 RepID=UPI001FF69AF6|nr:hypothetical protein [Cellulophaga sp. F20128]MCK0155839.1 hypothetical protein [Cellulophaga sp. F20128]
MLKKLGLLSVFILFTQVAISQALLDWDDMILGVAYDVPEGGAELGEFLTPTYTKQMIALEGKEISIIGYFLILEGEKDTYMLSNNPMASCFFCGNGGPETIIELYFDAKPTFLMDDLISVKGKLKLNRDNPDHTYYTIEQANGFAIKL